MKRIYLTILAISLAAVVPVFAADKSKASPSPGATETKMPRPIPFHGMVSAVDQNAKTFTIAGKTASRVFKVTDKTQVMKGSASAAMSDIVENEEVSGAYWKNADGSLEAKTVKIGPKSEAKTKKP